jgi:hypothetical protein
MNLQSRSALVTGSTSGIDLTAGVFDDPTIFRAGVCRYWTSATKARAGLLTQSMVILEYLEETYPEPPLLPADPFGRACPGDRERARVRYHPINTLRVLQCLNNVLGATSAQKAAWYEHWIARAYV